MKPPPKPKKDHISNAEILNKTLKNLLMEEQQLYRQQMPICASEKY